MTNEQNVRSYYMLNQSSTSLSMMGKILLNFFFGTWLSAGSDSLGASRAWM